MAKGVKASVEVLGLEALEKLLAQLGPKVAKTIVRDALKAASKNMLAATKAAAPVDTGLLKSALRMYPLKRKVGRVGFRIGYDTNKAVGVNAKGKKRIFSTTSKAKGNKALNTTKRLIGQTKAGVRHFYPAVVEYGSKNNPPHPFMRPAFNRHKDWSKHIIESHVRHGIEVEANKLLGK